MAADLAARKNDSNTPALWQRATESAQAAEHKLAQLALLAAPSTCAMADAAFRRALNATEHDIHTVAHDAENLLAAMRTELDP